MKNSVWIVLQIASLGAIIVLLGAYQGLSGKHYRLHRELSKQRSELQSLTNIINEITPVTLDPQTNLYEPGFDKLQRVVESLQTVTHSQMQMIEQLKKRLIEEELVFAKKEIPQKDKRLDILQAELDSLKSLLKDTTLQKRKTLVKRAQKRGRENSTGMKEFTATELYKAYKENDAAVQYNYGKKAILVTGEISHIMAIGSIIVKLKSNVGWGSISCHFNESQAEFLAPYKVGDKITIVGQYTGWGMVRKCAVYEYDMSATED